MSNLLSKLRKIEPLVKAATGNLEKSVYGIVDRVDNINGKLVPHVVRCWTGEIGNMEKTDKKPNVFICEKFEPLILKNKKYKCLYGGRGAMKTRFTEDVIVTETSSYATKTFVLRERKLSVKDSIKEGMISAIKRIGLGGFIPFEWEIRNANGGKIVYGGMQNITDKKGSSGFKRFLIEEAENTTQKVLDTLGPTLRGIDNAEFWCLWNTGSSQDAMSKEFIIPYQAELDKYGYYEDEHHIIIKVTYKDNYWFKHDKSLQQELNKDQIKVQKGIMTQARFNGIWNGAFNDDIANSVIKEDWFNACIDSHLKLGFEPKGAIVAACDPSDAGNDPFGFVVRHGNVLIDIREIEGENGNRKMDEACKIAISHGVDAFGYDADGLGATLRDNVESAFNGKNKNIFAYKGSSKIDFPYAEFNSSTANLSNSSKSLKNKDVLYNKKSQNILSFAERVFRTYESVVHNKYHDPETLISFCSKSISIPMMEKIKSEACKTPIKPANTVRFYTKQELRKGITLPDGNKMIIPSPNLFDAAVLSFDNASIIHNQQVVMPKAIKPIRLK